MVSKFKLNTSKNIETKNAISRTFEIAQNYAGEISIEVLPLEKIELDPENKRDLILTLDDAINGIDKNDPDIERKKQDWKSLESLSRTIQQNELMNPVSVYRFGNKCRLIAGERRTLASAIAGKKEILARISNQRPIGTKLRVLQWVENNERSDLSLPEKISSLECIIDAYLNEQNENTGKKNITAKKMSELTGISETQARRYLLVLQSSGKIRQAIEEKKIENLKLIELICSEPNQECQALLLEAALSGESFDSVLKIKREPIYLKSKFNKKYSRIKKTICLSKITPSMVKMIFSCFEHSTFLDKNITKKITTIDNGVEWSDIQSIEKSLKLVFELIEIAGFKKIE